jgi:AbrB family looped-hinge helix DNA binding protein
MIEIAKVTSKSRVTIPSSIRRKYGIRNGDKVQFVGVEGAVMMIPVKSLPEMYGLDKQHAKDLIEGIRELNREYRKEAAGPKGRFRALKGDKTVAEADNLAQLASKLRGLKVDARSVRILSSTPLPSVARAGLRAGET